MSYNPPDEPEGSRRDEAEHRASKHGPLAWFPQNSVAANVLMIVLLVGGALMILLGQIKQEVFPEVDLDMVVVNVPYPGASPEEVEQGVVLAVEEEVRGLEGVKEVRSTASEGRATVTVELLRGTDADRALSDVKSAVGRITSFPEDAEEPVISLATNRRKVLSLVLYGDESEHTLRNYAERARDELLQRPDITQVDLTGTRPLEISVEVPREKLREHDLTLGGIARTIRQASVDLPAGDVETDSGEILLRTKERRERGSEFENITVLSTPDGTEVKLRDIATIEDGFRDTDRQAYFNGKPAIMLNVYRVGDETPIEVSESVHAYLDQAKADLPPSLHIARWSDRSEMYEDRIQLLGKNALLGLVLVLLTLGVFLEIRLAFWVTLGIPISFLGAFLLMPTTDVTLNMISLFAFILTLGMVVDDAIVVGEAIYKYRQEGMGRLRAAISGVREVAVPVVFSILTTCIAFAPMLFVPGVMGKFFGVIPIIVFLVLGMSLVESLLVLPAHLAHSGTPKGRGAGAWLHAKQQRFGQALERFIEQRYEPFLRRSLQWRYLTVAAGLAVLIAIVGLVAGGRIKTNFMPKIEGEVVTATLQMPVGTAASQTRDKQRQITRAAQGVLEEWGGDDLARGVFADLGTNTSFQGGPMEGIDPTGSHLATVMVYLAAPEQRSFSAGDFAEAWRKRVGEIPGAETLKFDYDIGASSGPAIDVKLSHQDEDVLETAAAKLAGRLETFQGVKNIDDGFQRGKEQLDFKLRPKGRALGLREEDLARRVRASFFGAEALRQQRGRNEVRVYVRLPDEDRKTLHTVESMVLQTPQGGEIPLGEAAHVERGRAYTKIERTDGRRTLNVTGDVVPEVQNANDVMAKLQASALPQLMQDYPGLSWEKGGQQQDQAEAMMSLRDNFLFALLVMLCLLAVIFRSYLQPVIVLSAIPFGIVGAVLGHVLMGYNLSLMSMMGFVALSGVVVNASLILVVAINWYNREGGVPLTDAVVAGSKRRFRPILLTSLTTFFGLTPMILETSVQARFLIPMAVALGFGVLFAAGITLVLVPSEYLILDDLRRTTVALWQRYRRWVWGPQEPSRAEPTPGE